MPASGYKLFATGDVLTAADVNNYLMLQTVMVFANSAARTNALSGVLAEGLVSYLQDTNVVEIYTGAAWVSLDDPNAIQNTLLTTTGDMIAASAANTPARLAAGSSGQILTANGAGVLPSWQAPASSGALKLISSTAFSASSAVNVDNVFSTTYQYYKIIINVTSVSVATSIFQRMRVGGADTTSGYLSRFIEQNTTTISGQNQTQGYYLGETNTTGITWFSHSQEILNAFETRPTQMIGAGTESNGGTFYQTKTGGVLDNSTSYTGTTFYTISGNMTGTVRVYAYANS